MTDGNFFENFRDKWRILLISFFVSLMGIIMVLLILCYQIFTLCRQYSRRYDAHHPDDLGKESFRLHKLLQTLYVEWILLGSKFLKIPMESVLCSLRVISYPTSSMKGSVFRFKKSISHGLLVISYLWSISYGPLVMDHIILLEKRINCIIKANLRTIPGIKRHLEVIFSTAFLRSDNDPDHARVWLIKYETYCKIHTVSSLDAWKDSTKTARKLHENCTKTDCR